MPGLLVAQVIRTGGPEFTVRPTGSRKLGGWAIAGTHVPAQGTVYISTLRGAIIGYDDTDFHEKACSGARSHRTTERFRVQSSPPSNSRHNQHG